MPNGSVNRAKGPEVFPTPVVVERGTGNVFEDLDVPQPDIALAKAEIVQAIRQVIKESGWTQAQAAKMLRLDQPKVSSLLRGRVEGYTLDRLFRLLNALGMRVGVVILPNR